MYSLLLVIIYIAFISLGLPDALVGAAWPVMYGQLDAPISYAGIITMIIAIGTIVSSLLSERLTKKLGTGLVTAISVFMTAAALFGFSISTKFYMLCLWAIPYGVGAGAVDAALNNYVALNYSSRHMSWLHGFWGIGDSVGPYIMGYFLSGGNGWDKGFLTVAIVQIVLTAALFISLPLWKKNKGKKKQKTPLRLKEVARIKGVLIMCVAFFAYCGVETTAGLWASSYLVEFRGITPDKAARYASIFYLGITIGRFLVGSIADKIKDKQLIRIGTVVLLSGIVFIAIPMGIDMMIVAGLFIVGLGCAPIYPSIIHAAPSNFGKENSQAIIGVQMASAYTGSTLMSPLFGLIAEKINIGAYPLYLLLLGLIILIMTEVLNNILRKKEYTLSK
ncbi:MAG TPA: MFS transporter [Clostridiales bacterium]|nr:MFS transporter [Clostridiales bacterium]